MKKTVMVIDDEPDFCFFLKQNLEAAGDFGVVTISDAVRAVSQIRSVKPDIVLLDVMMPGVSGPDIAQELKNDVQTKNIPVVFLTAIVEEEQVKQKQNLIGGWLYISKPVKIDELVALVHDLTR
ncbi:MAG: response regulator [Candidatus Omnitrophica bacterium]|nr:response regulator [Candidatus Omnitrophota bacterium]